MFLGKYSVVCVARNEENVIGKTLQSINKQTIPPVSRIVVDDGSHDNTAQISTEIGWKVIRLPPHRMSYVGRPELAIRWNVGFKAIENENLNYILMTGADSLYPPNYVEKLISLSSGCGCSGGRIRGHNIDVPIGGGRLIDSKWFHKVGFRFPVRYGWEAWMLYKAIMDGRMVKVFPEVEMITRKIRRGEDPVKMREWGTCCWSQGSNPLFFLHSPASVFLESPQGAINMIIGFFRHGDNEQLDIADFCAEEQKRRTIRMIRHVFNGL